MLYFYIALIVQSIAFVAIFDKMSYFYGLSYFCVAALAYHLQMYCLWQIGALAMGVLCELSVYRIDIWEELVDPFKFFNKTNIVVAIVASIFCVGFIYQAATITKLDLFTWNAFFYWVVILYLMLAAIMSAVNITDYLCAKTVATCKLKINNIQRKQVPRMGTINYLNANVNGTDYKFVTTSVAYSVLKNRSEIAVNLWKAQSGAIFIKNDFLREERGAWRVIQIKTGLTILALIVIVIVYYFSR